MKAAAGLGLLSLLAVGAYLVVAEGGTVATGYALGAAALVAVLLLRLVDAWLPTPPGRPLPLYRLASLRRGPEPPRPGALLDWEAALLSARVHGGAARIFGARLAPLVGTHLRERRGMDPDDPRALELLGPTWAQIRPGAPDGGANAEGASLDDIEDLVRRLEGL